MGFYESLYIEDDPAFLEVTCPTTGVLAWPVIRQDVLRLLIGDRVDQFAPLVDFTRRPSLSRLAATATRATIHNLRHPAQPSRALLVGDWSRAGAASRRFFNRHLDYFARSLGNEAWTVEATFGGTWPKQPRTNGRVDLAAQRLEVAILSQLSIRSTHRRLARDLVALAEQRGRDRLGWEMGTWIAETPS